MHMKQVSISQPFCMFLYPKWMHASTRTLFNTHATCLSTSLPLSLYTHSVLPHTNTHSVPHTDTLSHTTLSLSPPPVRLSFCCQGPCSGLPLPCPCCHGAQAADRSLSGRTHTTTALAVSPRTAPSSHKPAHRK